MKFGIFDALDKSWGYDNKGPLLYDKLEEANLAAKSVSLKLKQKNRFFARLFPENGSIKLAAR